MSLNHRTVLGALKAQYGPQESYFYQVYLTVLSFKMHEGSKGGEKTWVRRSSLQMVKSECGERWRLIKENNKQNLGAVLDWSAHFSVITV